MIKTVVAKVFSTNTYLQVLKILKVLYGIADMLTSISFNVIEVKVQSKYLEISHFLHQ